MHLRTLSTRSAPVALWLALALTRLPAADWPQWRGPSFDGSTEAKGLPETWGPAESLRWAVEMPGPSGATPIILGERIFLSSYERKESQVLALCLERQSGKELWRKRIGAGKDSRERGRENYMSECSPAGDAERVVFLSGAGDLAAFSHDGAEIWRQNVQESYGGFNIMWGYASSPLLLDGRVYVQVLHRDSPYGRSRGGGQSGYKVERNSYLLALDAKTGKEIFRQVRPEEAVAESKESYSTPIPRRTGGRVEVVLQGGDCVTGHDPASGAELWRFGGWNPEKIGHWRIVASPVLAGKLVYASGPKQGPILAVEVDGSAATTKWTLDRNTTDVATPLVYKGRIYVLSDRNRIVTCLEAESGKKLWEGRLPCDLYFRASLTAADDKVFAINADGEAFAFAAGPEFKLLNHAKFGGYPAHASIAIAGDRFFIRTAEKLYCIGK
jgi:outer membrane protein assembly factor BamB